MRRGLRLYWPLFRCLGLLRTFMKCDCCVIVVWTYSPIVDGVGISGVILEISFGG